MFLSYPHTLPSFNYIYPEIQKLIWKFGLRKIFPFIKVFIRIFLFSTMPADSFVTITRISPPTESINFINSSNHRFSIFLTSFPIIFIIYLTSSRAPEF